MKEIIYVYTTETYKSKNWYKIGMTTQESADVRISQQYGTSNPEKLEKQYEINLFGETELTAYEVEQKIHRFYERLGKRVDSHREWFEVDGGIEEIKKVIESILDNSDLHKSEIKLKPHQVQANTKINDCFNSDDKRCLLAHKPRSGKTFTTIYNIKENNYKNVVILTSYPILNFQWEEVILGFKGFSNTEIIIGSGLDKIELNPDKNSIVLLSLQDVKGGEEVFEKEKFELIKDIEFDLLVIDEVHYGTETEKTQDFLSKIKYERMLGLSATPTRNILAGRFSKEQIHNYTLVEEVQLKKQYPELYPYADINFLIWNLSNDEKSELKYFSDEEQFKFDKFFRIEGDNFYYKSDIIYLFKKLIGDRDICRRDKLGTSYPFKNNGEFSVVKSILLFVPNITVQYKLKDLLEELESYDDFNIHITNSVEYSSKVLIKKIKRDFKSGDKRSLILAVDQLTTGITLDDCDMVALMNDWRSVDKYVQASFRCQSPREGKTNCWVLDFNAARSFELMWEYQNVISKNNGKPLTENISEWVECVNIFNRIEGEMIKVDFDGFNNEYNKAVLERPRFNYQSVILQDKLGHDNISKALMAIGIKGGSSSSDEDLNDDGIDKGKSKKSEKKSGGGKSKVDEGISQAKLMEIAKALVDKTMLLSIFTYFKYDNVDDCFKALEEDNTIVDGIDELEKKMYLETLLLGMNDVDNVNLSVIKFIYDNIYDKEIINKKLYLFNQNVNLIYNSIRENPVIISDMLGNLMELVDSYLKPSNTEKKMLGEVFTSLKLVEEMLDKLPKEVWSNPDLKWLDPANGIGNFPVIIVKNLMEGLKEWQPDSELRLKHILENMIYVCELQSKNMFIYLQLFDPENKYKLNFHRGSFLDEGFSEVMKEWGVEKFDIVVGNPPYQDSPKSDINKTSGSVLWDKFVNKSIDILSNLGYLVFVHPAIWRKPINNKTKIIDILGIFKKFNLMYLEIHDVKDGLKTFNAGTRYDFYCFQKSEKYNNTTIRDEEGEIINVNIRTMKFIPNKKIDKVMSLIGDDKISVIFDSAYHASREYISKEKTKENIYEVIHSTPKDGPRILYSSLNNKGHFGISKIIFGEAGINDVIIDIDGDYGMTQGAIGLVIDKDDDPYLIKKVIESKEFSDIIDSCMWSNFRIDAKLFMLFKKQWYKNIIVT
jgi:superfamily II DNA or RNA helicase